MQVIVRDDLRMLLSDEGKKIRSIDDVYEEAYIDEDGNEVPAKEPYYTSIIFLAKDIDINKIDELYVEEET